MKANRGGLALAEIVMAVALAAIVGVPILGMLAATDHEAMTSTDYMQAEATAQREIANLLALPWKELERELPIQKKLERGTVTATRLEDGLISLEVQIQWPVHPNSPAMRRYGLVRLRARPDLSIRAQYPFGDGEGNR